MKLRARTAVLLLMGAIGLGASVRGLSTESGNALAQQPVLSGIQSEPRDGRQGREFYFTRAMYSSYGRRSASWRVDFPKADVQFLIGVRRLTNIDAYEFENPVGLDDPGLRRYPFLYALEVGRMALSPAEVQGLRSYLLAGGFLVIDDFWDMDQWQNFEYEINQVLPEYRIVDIPMDHPLLSAFYEIDELLQVPNRSLAAAGGRTGRGDGAHARGQRELCRCRYGARAISGKADFAIFSRARRGRRSTDGRRGRCGYRAG